MEPKPVEELGEELREQCDAHRPSQEDKRGSSAAQICWKHLTDDDLDNW